MANVTLVSHRPEVMDEVHAAINRALEIIGGKAESYAKRQCPVDTGRLRNSITHVQYNENTEIIGSNVEYSPFVELGTIHQDPRPYLRPAAEYHVLEYKTIFAKELSKVK